MKVCENQALRLHIEMRRNCKSKIRTRARLISVRFSRFSFDLYSIVARMVHSYFFKSGSFKAPLGFAPCLWEGKGKASQIYTNVRLLNQDNDAVW